MALYLIHLSKGDVVYQRFVPWYVMLVACIFIQVSVVCQNS